MRPRLVRLRDYGEYFLFVNYMKSSSGMVMTGGMPMTMGGTVMMSPPTYTSTGFGYEKTYYMFWMNKETGQIYRLTKHNLKRQKINEMDSLWEEYYKINEMDSRQRYYYLKSHN